MEQETALWCPCSLGLLKSLQRFESLSGIPVLALCECQHPLQERLDRSRSERSRRQCVGLDFHPWIAKDVIVASLRHAVANKMRHLVTQKTFEGNRIEQLDRLLPDDNLASPVYDSALAKNVIEPVFGVTDPRRDKRIDFVGGGRGLEELERLVTSGAAAVAFALHPTKMADLMAVADTGQIMPPKSTWFEPSSPTAWSAPCWIEGRPGHPSIVDRGSSAPAVCAHLLTQIKMAHRQIDNMPP